MTFNISRFKSQLDNFGGPSRASLFEMQIYQQPVRGSAINSSNFNFFCQTVQVPGIDLESVTYMPVAGRPVMFPTGVAPSQLNTIFMMDSEHQLLSFFHKWIQNVVNYGTTSGKFSEVNGKLPFEIGYMQEYSARLVIRHYTTGSDNDRYYEYILDGAYPISIGEVDLSWAQNDSYLTLPVRFAYERIQYSGEVIGSPLSGLGRGYGFFDALGAIAGFAGTVQQTVDQGLRFTSIQDAINRIYRVRNSFGKMSNVLG